jgi:hypothetical protein
MYDSKPVTMKRKDTIINILIFVVIVGGALVYRYMQSVVPYWQCSEVYKRYAHTKDIRATYIKNFPLNDTLTVGVTLLEATTDSGWARLQEDFAVIPVPPEALAFCDSNTVNVWLAAKRDYSLRADSILLNNDLIAMNYMKHIISVFKLESEEQRDAILHYQATSITLNTN